jgi:hypothetical protein
MEWGLPVPGRLMGGISIGAGTCTANKIIMATLFVNRQTQPLLPTASPDISSPVSNQQLSLTAPSLQAIGILFLKFPLLLQKAAVAHPSSHPTKTCCPSSLLLML